MSEHNLRAGNCEDIRARTVFPSLTQNCPVCSGDVPDYQDCCGYPPDTCDCHENPAKQSAGGAA